MKNLIVYKPTEEFVNFLNTHYFSHERKGDIIEVDNYKLGSFKGVIGVAKTLISGKWVAI
ncbi:MAG: hypothetical protein WC976_06120 [Caldisericia bacterium]